MTLDLTNPTKYVDEETEKKRPGSKLTLPSYVHRLDTLGKTGKANSAQDAQDRMRELQETIEDLKLEHSNLKFIKKMIEDTAEPAGPRTMTLKDMQEAKYAQINGSVRIIGDETITDLRFISTVERINANLEVSGCASLKSLAGLEALTFIGGDLIIRDNPSLRSVAGLGSLDSLGGAVIISRNDQLESLAGMEHHIFSRAMLNGLYVADNENMACLEGAAALDRQSRRAQPENRFECVQREKG